MSLDGRTIVVTRAAEQAGTLETLLEAEGARVIALPTIAIEEPSSYDELDAALDRVTDYDWIAVGSVNAAERLIDRAAVRSVSLEQARFACVGEKTARFVQARLPEARRLVPPEYRSEGLFEALRAEYPDGLEGRRVLFPRAAEGRERLIQLLQDAGVRVDAVTAYQIGRAPAATAAQIADLERADAFSFLSGKTLERFLEVVPEVTARRLLDQAVVAVIGPVAKQAADDLGIRVDVVPGSATVEALVAALTMRLGK